MDLLDVESDLTVIGTVLEAVKSRDPTVIGTVLEAVKSPDLTVLGTVLEAAKILDPTLIGTVLEAVKSQDLTVIGTVLEAVKSRDPTVIGAVLEAVKSLDLTVIGTVLEAVKSRDPTVIGTVLEAVKSRDPTVIGTVLEAVKSRDPTVIGTVLEAVKSRDLTVIGTVLEAVKSRDPTVIGTVIEAVKSRDPTVIGTVLEAVKSRDPTVIGTVIGAVKSRDPTVIATVPEADESRHTSSTIKMKDKTDIADVKVASVQASKVLGTKKKSAKEVVLKPVQTGIQVVGDFFGRMATLIVMVVTTINTSIVCVNDVTNGKYWSGGLHAFMLAFVHIPVIIVMIWLIIKAKVQAVYRKIRPRKPNEPIVVTEVNEVDGQTVEFKEKTPKAEMMTAEKVMNMARKGEQLAKALQGGHANKAFGMMTEIGN